LGVFQSLIVDFVDDLLKLVPRDHFELIDELGVVYQLLDLVGAEGYNRVGDHPYYVPVKFVIPCLVLVLLVALDGLTDLIELVVKVLELVLIL